MGRGGRTATSFLVRDDLRRRWRLVVVVGVLVGLTAGAGLACIAGARRTQTSFPRHLEASNAADLEIDPGQLDPESDAALHALPGVEEASYWKTTSVFILNDEGRLREDAVGLLTITSDGRYLDMDEVSIIEGRRVDGDDPDEVMINEALAETADLGVGDTLPLGYFPTDPDSDFPTTDRPVDPIDATIVGIMALNEDVVSEQLETGLERLYFSPAYEPPDPSFDAAGFAWYGLRLTDGQAGADEVINEWNDVATRHNEEHQAEIEQGEVPQWLSVVRRTEDLQAKAELAVRPLVIALATFGLALSLTVLFLGSQALTRSARQESDRLRSLRQLGLDRGTLIRSSLAVPVVTVGIAVLAAFGTAWALSSRFPAGPFVGLEPHPGHDLDWVVLGAGVALLAVVPVGAVALTLNRSVSRLLQPEVRTDRSSRVALWLARGGAPEPVSAAVRLTAPGRGASYVPTRSVLTSTVVIVAVLVAGLVFGENLRTLDEEPLRFGWSGDGLVMSDGGYGGFVPPGEAPPEGSSDIVVEQYLADHDDVVGWRLVGGDRTAIDGRVTPGIMYGPSEGSGDDFQPVLLDGHAPQAADEVVLGRETLARAGKEIGDTVTLGTGDQTATIVGTAVFPVFGPILAVKTDLGVGAWVSADAQVFNFVGQDYGPPFNGLLIDLAPGSEVAQDETSEDLFPVIKPIEVTTTTDATRYEPALTAALGVTGLLAILLTLAAVVRRRRFELSMYRVLGFRPRQLRATIGLQGVIFGVGALVVGVPVGVVVGRELWRRFAHTLGVVDTTDVPWNLVAIAAGAVLVVTALSAVPPAIAAGRRRDQPRDERG
jgi:hypothetical protein